MSHKSDSREGGADKDSVECANRCGKGGTKRCSGCTAVLYCSPACQRDHWSKGGHKAACKAVQMLIRVSAMASGRTPTAVSRSKAKADSTGACIICLDEEPPPIQSGCACRGDAGLAHVACRMEAAVHRHESTKSVDRWSTCGTCGQMFSGAMQIGLAESWWAKVRDLPEDNLQRRAASVILSSALQHIGEYARAEAMLRDNLAVQRRFHGPHHQAILVLQTSLANSLTSQGKHADAEVLFRKILRTQRRVLGPENPATLRTSAMLTTALVAQGKHADAEAMYQQVLTVLRRVLGPEHPDTLLSSMNLATSIDSQGRYADAEAMYREVLAVQRRVFGPEHPTTLLFRMNLAATLDKQGKYTEGEAMHQEILVMQRRVLGPNHPDTARTAQRVELHRSMSSSEI